MRSRSLYIVLSIPLCSFGTFSISSFSEPSIRSNNHGSSNSLDAPDVVGLSGSDIGTPKSLKLISEIQIERNQSKLVSRIASGSSLTQTEYTCSSARTTPDDDNASDTALYELQVPRKRKMRRRSSKSSMESKSKTNDSREGRDYYWYHPRTVHFYSDGKSMSREVEQEELSSPRGILSMVVRAVVFQGIAGLMTILKEVLQVIIQMIDPDTRMGEE